MSEVSEFIDKLYKLSEGYKIAEAEAFIETKIDFFVNCDNYQYIDSILYGLDLNKVKVSIVKLLITKCFYYEKLIMKKDFVSRAIDHFGKNALL